MTRAYGVAALVLAGLGVFAPKSARPQGAAPATADPTALYSQLSHITVDPGQVYLVHGAEIDRGGAKIFFDRGFVALLAPVGGEVTGAAFSGEGEVLLIPTSPVEKQNLDQFIGAPILEEHFVSAFMRFTDRTAQEILAQARRPGPDDPEVPTGFVEYWDAVARRFDPAYSGPILAGLLGDPSKPFFQSQFEGVELGTFQVTDDERLPEAVSVGAVRTAGGRPFADLWCSFPSRTSKARGNEAGMRAARVVSYKLDIVIHPDNRLEGRAELELQSLSDKERALVFQLSRGLKVTAARDEQGRSLAVFQGESRQPPGPLAEGDFMAVLSVPLAPGTRYRLTFDYQGQVIADVGNGVLYVGAHDNWYPNLGVQSPALYDLTFRYPDRLTLVATGDPVEEETLANAMKRSHWVSKAPLPVAGFNLGNYVSRERRAGSTKIKVYATREAESALERRNVPTMEIIPSERSTAPHLPEQTVRAIPQPLSPAALMDRVGDRAAEAVEYFQSLFGPFPYSRLAISQIPGEFGQGWPELVYLPTFYFLPDRERVEVSPENKVSDLEMGTLLPHEVAHQWWGNEVGWKTYHDQWLSEGFATYAAAMFLGRRDGGKKFGGLLKQYRQELLSKNKTGATIESGGPIWLGERLSNSLNPRGYNDIVYKKACWVIHMLHVLMTDPETGSDQRFAKMLRDFVATYRGRSPSTEEFIRHAEKYMPPAMDLDHNGSLDWFFNNWVYGTGIPAYKIETKTRRLNGGRLALEGTIEQDGVPEGFEMLVPVVAIYEKDRKVKLGLVPVGDSGGRFHFVVATRPHRVTIDSDDLLAVSE
jgi:peptidase M1-like protein